MCRLHSSLRMEEKQDSDVAMRVASSAELYGEGGRCAAPRQSLCAEREAGTLMAVKVSHSGV